MKRISLMILTMCLMLSALPASAETVAEQVSAPATVQDACASNTGRTTIAINARVVVPNAEAMYLIPVDSVAFDDAQVTVLAELTWPGLGKGKLKVDEGNDTSYLEGRKMKGYWRHDAVIAHRATKKDDTYVQAVNTYCRGLDMEGVYSCTLGAMIEYDTRYRLKQTINYTGAYMMDEVTGEGIEGHPLTRAQAIDICETFINGLTDVPFELFAVGKAPGIIQDDERILAGTNMTGTGYSYALTFTRKVEGVSLLPALGASMSTASWRDDLYTTPVGYEEIMMAINLEGQVTNFSWSNPYAIDQRTEAQTLLSFDQILAIAKQVLPLKYQWKEADGSDTALDVKRIQLGYMALLQRDKLSFALTPVWTFYGTKENSVEGVGCIFPQLTINAVDGTVVDLEYGY